MIKNVFKNWFVFMLLVISIIHLNGCREKAAEAPVEEPAMSAPAEEEPVESIDSTAAVGDAGIASGEEDPNWIELYKVELEKEIMPEIPGGYKNKLLKKSLLKKMKTFGDVEFYIDSILSIAGFETNKRFLVDGGFGIASDVENIKADGESEREQKRFNISFDFSKCEGNWLEKFLYPRSACRTRMFVFIFSKKPFQNKPDDHLSLVTIREWAAFGFTSLPYDIKNKILDNSYDLNVLVYEYEVTDINSKGKLNKSGLSVIDHLKKAKLWHQEMGM